MSRECVEHFVSGQDAWRLGVIGFLSRLRGVAATILVAIATMGIPWWWPSTFFSGNIAVSPTYIFVAAVVLTVTVLLSGLFYLRQRTIRSLEVKHELHELAHFIRDSHATYGEETETQETEKEQHFNDFVSSLCERSKQYFARIFWDHNVAVAVRLAVASPQDTERDILYCTVGRSTGLDARRASASEPIAATEGIARYLRDRNSLGVLIYNDLEKAATLGAFKKTKNERTFPHEVQSMMVAPLNGWDSKQKSMIGILFVTSPRKYAFGAKDVDSVRFIADALANAISTVVDKLTTAKRMRDLARKVSKHALDIS